MLVTIKAAKGRHVFVGESPLSDKYWATHPISAAIVKAIKEGDIVEAVVDEAPKVVDEAPKEGDNKPAKK